MRANHLLLLAIAAILYLQFPLVAGAFGLGDRDGPRIYSGSYHSFLYLISYEAVRGELQPTGPITPTGYYGTDAGHLYAVGGMEGVVCGPGGRYNTMPDERVDIPDYLDMIRIYLLTICDICELT